MCRRPQKGGLYNEKRVLVSADDMCVQGKALLDSGFYPFMGTSNLPSYRCSSVQKDTAIAYAKAHTRPVTSYTP